MPASRSPVRASRCGKISFRPRGPFGDVRGRRVCCLPSCHMFAIAECRLSTQTQVSLPSLCSFYPNLSLTSPPRYSSSSFPSSSSFLLIHRLPPLLFPFPCSSSCDSLGLHSRDILSLRTFVFRALLRFLPSSCFFLLFPVSLCSHCPCPCLPLSSMSLSSLSMSPSPFPFVARRNPPPLAPVLSRFPSLPPFPSCFLSLLPSFRPSLIRSAARFRRSLSPSFCCLRVPAPCSLPSFPPLAASSAPPSPLMTGPSSVRRGMWRRRCRRR